MKLKAKIVNETSLNLSFCTAKAKRQPTEWEKIFVKWCNQQEISLQNIQTAHAAQKQQKPNQKKKKKKNGQKI